MNADKALSVSVVALSLLLVITGAGFGIQTVRLGRCMESNRRYRERIESAEDQQSAIRDALRDADRILDQAGNSVGELRKLLEEIEANYKRMYSIVFGVNYDDGGASPEVGY